MTDEEYSTDKHEDKNRIYKVKNDGQKEEQNKRKTNYKRNGVHFNCSFSMENFKVD